MSYSSDISASEALALLVAGNTLLDVRSPIEFHQSGFNPSEKTQVWNSPLLTNTERDAIGTMYKQRGQQNAIELGHWFVHGAIKDQRIATWLHHISTHNIQALYCARGGMRSKIVTQWLQDAGIQLRRVHGGYKAMRHGMLQVLETIPQQQSYTVISGRTGSGKTELLHKLKHSLPIIDLEAHAKHCGSAFGAIHGAQPAQATFENEIALALLKIHEKSAQDIFIEDESRMVGNCVVPNSIITAIRNAPHLVIHETKENRIQRIIFQYVLTPLKEIQHPLRYQMLEDQILSCIQKISRRLGGERTQVIRRYVQDAIISHRSSGDSSTHERWVNALLTWYYDPIYDRNLSRYTSQIIHTCSYDEAYEYCMKHKNLNKTSLCIEKNGSHNKNRSQSSTLDKLQTLPEHCTS